MHAPVNDSMPVDDLDAACIVATRQIRHEFQRLLALAHRRLDLLEQGRPPVLDGDPTPPHGVLRRWGVAA